MEKLIIAAVLTIFATIGMASAAEKVSPTTVAGATTVDAVAAKTLFDRGVPFVDVRTEELWDLSRVPGAIFLELFTAFNEANILKVAAKDQEVVIYCAGANCNRSSKACAKAIKWGFQKVYYFRGGFPAWQAAGYPTDPP